MITDDTGTVPKGHWEINAAFTIERAADGRSFAAPLLDVNYGLSKISQIKIEIPWLIIHRNGQKEIGGLGNTNIGVRWRFRSETKTKRVALSIYPQFEFNNPTSSIRRGLVDKGSEFLMPLQWQTQVGKYGVGGDVGYRFKRGTDEIMSGIIIGRKFKDTIEILGEIHTNGLRNNLKNSEIVCNFGTRIKLGEHLTFLGSIGKTLRQNSNPRFIGYTGLQISF